MPTTSLTDVATLPALTDLVPLPEWERDLVAASHWLFDAGVGLLRDPEGNPMAVRNADVRTLAAHPDLGNMPTEGLMGRSALRTEPGDPDADRVVTPEPPKRRAFERWLRNQIFTTNPPLHPPQRRVVARQLTPRNILRFAPAARELADSLVDELAGTGEVEFGRAFAGRFVTRFWTAQLGMSQDQAAEVQRLMEEMNQTFLLHRTPQQTRRVFEATDRYQDLVGDAVRAAWARGGNALLEEMAAELEQIDQPGRAEDIGTLVASNFFDGFHTVGVGVSNTLFHLLRHPDALEQVRTDPGLAGAAFFEGTRVSSPLMLTSRQCLAEVEHAGVRIPAGSPVVLVWAAANHDPKAFPDPDAYRLDRPMPGATTFGGGVHLCPGRNAARMLVVAALEALAAPNVEVTLAADRYRWVPGHGIRHLAALPVTIRRTR